MNKVDVGLMLKGDLLAVKIVVVKLNKRTDHLLTSGWIQVALLVLLAWLVRGFIG